MWEVFCGTWAIIVIAVVRNGVGEKEIIIKIIWWEMWKHFDVENFHNVFIFSTNFPLHGINR